MAKLTITRACGCTEVHNIVGPEKGRAAKAERLRADSCTACKRNEATAKAAAETTDLPALVGSEKQIAWAVTIRSDAIKAARAAAEMAREKYEASTADTAAERVIDLESITAAKFWIENRGLNDHLHAGPMWMGAAHKHKGE